MNAFQCPSIALLATPRRALMLLAAISLFAGTNPAMADMASVNRDIWRMAFDATSAQVTDPLWLAGDADGDGISNGDELAAGTNPFNPSQTIRVSSVNLNAGNAVLTFPTEPGKRYRAEMTTSLTSPTWVLQPQPTPTVVMGDGGDQSITLPYTANAFYRIRVDDVDSDGDGVSDWSEMKAGFDPHSDKTNGLTLDGTALQDAINSSNVVSVTVARSSATQPSDAFTAPVESGSIVISRAGILKFNSITIPLHKTGTASEGVDYNSLPNSVTLLPGVGQVVLTVNPKHNPARRTNVTATVTVLAGGGYSLGSAVSGSVLLNPPGLANGTGLTGQYYNNSDSSYVNQVNNIFDAVAPNMTRVDAAIDFANRIASIAVGSPAEVTTVYPHEIAVGSFINVRIAGVSGGTFSGGTTNVNQALRATATGPNTFTLATTAGVAINCTVQPTSVVNSTLGGTNGWDSAAGPIGMNAPATGGHWSVRWTGQVLPKYSETYSFDFRSDDGAKVWVNGKLLVDKWGNAGLAENVNTIALRAGVLYDIQVDYLSWNINTAEARLYWWSPSQTKEIIPQSRLFPAPAQSSKFTAITSAQKATGYVSVPFVFRLASTTLSAPDSTPTSVTYALAPNSGALPPGLSLDGSTGVISGTPTTAGTYNVAIDSTNTAAGAVRGSTVVDITIFPTGGITRETLDGSGTPTGDGSVAALDDDTDYANNVSRRLRGYFIPPKTGNYYFWLAANNTAELWISNNADYVNRVRRAYVTASTGKKVWNASPTQQSAWLALNEGEHYYIEVLHNTGGDADDYVNVGWLQDDVGTVISVTGDPNPTGATPIIANGSANGAGISGYPLSGTMPSYVFQPYDYPNLAPTDGSLYASNMGPQAGAQTSASGSVNLRVNPSGTQGILYFTYQNLTTPRTAYHLHVDAFDGHPQGEIVYDIDDADFLNTKTADGGYIWNFAATGTFSSAAQILDAIQRGKVYLNVHSVNYPNGEIRGTLQLIDGSQTPPIAAAYPEPVATDNSTSDADAARFLNQATFGANPADIAFVKANGFSAWIDAQLTKATSRTSGDVVAGITSDINQPYPSILFTNTWWKYAITGQDQLRQRLAFALSEILVVSWANNTGPLQNNGRILADYYDNLLDYGLPTAGIPDSGNFKGVLKAVTLTPAMGLYLDMRGNQKGDDTIGRHPNENYAREIMQLFSVGLFRMWDDGKFIIGSDAGLVATYNQPTILGLSALLTGWNYAQQSQANGRAPTGFGPAADYLNPMVLVPVQHDLGPKLLLNNTVSPPATGRTPRVTLASVSQAVPGNPSTAVLNTLTPHGLTVGDTVRISGINGGSFSASINNTHAVTEVVNDKAFKVGINCNSVSGISYSSAAVTGANVLSPSFSTSGITAVTGSQSDNSNFSGWTSPHPYDQYGLKELDLAIDTIVQNDNVAPYICRQLIQRFVTSDPSPGYLYRVVQKFKNNGSGVRGDLSAVVKQILLDGEARRSSVTQSSPSFGKQREPMLRVTGPARAFPATPYSGTYTQLTGVNSSKLRITTSASNAFSAGFTVGLNFQGNYTSTNPPDPWNNPTSTAYGVASTLGIAKTWTTVSNIEATNPCRVTTSEPHGLTTGATIRITGLSTASTGGTYNGSNSTYLSGTSRTISVIDANTFTITGVSCTLAPASVASAKLVSSPCRITTATAHGLNTGDYITISNVSGGSFSPTISNSSFPVTVVDATSFTIPVACTSASTDNTGNIVGGNTFDVTATGMVNASYSQTANTNILTVSTAGPQTNVAVPGTAVAIASISTGNPCTVTTSGNHNLVTGGVVSILGITDGTFSTSINSTFVPTVTSGTTFTIPVNCTVAPTNYASATTTKLIRSRVYLHFLTQNTGGGAPLPTPQVYDVITNPNANSFTITTNDTPTTGRSGNVLLPKISTSYTPTSNFDLANSANTVVILNTNVNHNLREGDHFWADVPVIGTPLTDAEYIVPARDLDNATNTKLNFGIDDEDHLRIAYLPFDANGGTYPKPIGSTNGVNLYPLVPSPLGRSGTVSISQSTFNLGSTEGTLSQSPLNSPTVFNFFFPDYKFPGALANSGLDSPEFQLTTDTNVANLTNSVVNMFIGTGGGNSNLNGLCSFNNGNGSVVMDLGPYMTDAKTANGGIPALVDELTNLLIGSPLSTATRTEIINLVTNTTYFPYTTPTPQQKRDRVRAIIHLITTSAEYAVQK